MKQKFVDCFMLMGTALSLRGGQKLPEMGRPLLQDVFTTVVNLSLTVQEFKIAKNEIEVGTLLNQKWIDPRLGANIKTRKMAVAGQIWKPKITNSLGQNINCDNDDTVFWRGFGDEGNVLLSEKLKLKAPCTQNYHKFPFDAQICEFKFGSYRFPQEEVELVWDLNPVEVVTDLNLNEFRVINVTTYHEIDIRQSGNFSIAVIQFVLERRYFHYVQCIALPCLILSLLNYVSLWFDLNKRTARLVINAVTFGLMLCYYYISICLAQPAPYLKAIDIFVLMCESFSLVTLLETLFIDNLCAEEEVQFHLKKTACSKEYPKVVYWVELGIKISYPVFYVFGLILCNIMYLR